MTIRNPSPRPHRWGGSHTYPYDRLTGVRYDGETSDRYAYEYGADGQASVVRDNSLGRVAQTACDLSGRATESQLRDASGNVLYRAGMTYDARNRLTGLNETANGQAHATTYAYDNDNRVTGMTFDGGNAISYTYDSLGRIASRTASPLSTTYGYVAGGYGTGSTTPLVASIQQTIPFSYAYDSRGNIVSETRSGQTTTYEYDALGQLTRVNDPHENATWVYAYDRGGNMTSKVRYAYTTGTLGTAEKTYAYSYGDSAWKDKLTSFNGRSFTYDAIGNPLSDSIWSYTWQAGRQLKKMSRTGVTIEYKYDHNGLRTQKLVTENGTTTATNYTMSGKRLVHLSNGAHELHFFYDAQGRPAKVDYNGTIYTYIHNLQGDVVGMLDNSGNLVVEYKYDAWGKAIATTGSLAATLGKRNPFRYRGYVYDEETELYYLRSRYYSGLLGRFITPDVVYKGNLYTYCYGKPLEHIDSSGRMPVTVLNAISGAYNLGLIDDSSVSAAVIVLNGGNVYNAFHEIAQLNVAKKLYSMGYVPVLEYGIPGVGEADIVAGTFVWEVKPISTTAVDQPGKYMAKGGLVAGFDIDEITGIPIVDDIKMRVASSGGGVLHYSFYNDRRDVRSSEVRSNVKGRLFWAALAFITVMGGTILEDVLSGGAGIADDIPSLGAAGSLAALILG